MKKQKKNSNLQTTLKYTNNFILYYTYKQYIILTKG